MWVILLIAGLAYLKTQADKVQQSINITRISLSKSPVTATGDLLFDVELSVNNPSSIQPVLKSVFCEIFLQGKKIGTVNWYGSYLVAGNKISKIVFPVSLQVGSVIQSASDFLAQMQSFFVNVRGNVNLSGVSIPINSTTQLL